MSTPRSAAVTHQASSRSPAASSTGPVASDVVGIWRDAAWWVSPDSTPVAPTALEFSRQPGKWKVDRHAPITEEMRAAYAAGSAVAFRDGLIASLKDEP
jgi:hypothetical protein